MSLLNNMNQTAAGGLAGGEVQSQAFVMGLDALGGYVFARMAHNGGEMSSGSPSELNILLLRIGIVANSMLYLRQAMISARIMWLLRPGLFTG